MSLNFERSIHAEAKSNILDLSRALALDLDVLIERLRECSGSLLHSPFSSLVGSVDPSLIEGRLLNFKSALTAFTTFALGFYLAEVANHF